MIREWRLDFQKSSRFFLWKNWIVCLVALKAVIFLWKGSYISFFFKTGPRGCEVAQRSSSNEASGNREGKKA